MVVFLKDDITDEELRLFFFEAIKGSLNQYSMSRKPGSNLLEDCLENYTKDKLVSLSAENGVDVKKSWKKKRLIQPLHDQLFETMPERVLLLDDWALEQLKKFVLGKFSQEGMTVEETEFFVNVYPIAVRLGLLFSMGNEKNLKTIITAELLDVLNNLDTVKEENYEKLEFAKQLDEVLKAAVRLYGIIDKTRVIKLWEIKYPDFKFTLDFYDYLETILPILAIKNDYFSINKRFIASPIFINSEEAKDYQSEILGSVGTDYYVPTQSDIQYYAEHSFDRQSKAYEKLEQFVSEHTPDFDIVMKLIEENLVKSGEVSYFLNTLAEIELMNFKTEKQLESFLDRYIKLLNNTRLWEIAGYTPLELGAKITREALGPMSLHSINRKQEDKKQDNVIPFPPFQEK